MMKSRIVRWMILFTTILLSSCLVFFVSSTYADEDSGMSSSVEKKFAMIGLKDCYNSKVFVENLEVGGADSSKQYPVSDFIGGTPDTKSVRLIGATDSATVSCLDLLKSSHVFGVDGWHMASNGFAEFGKAAKRLGYTATGSNLDKCLQYQFKVVNGDETFTSNRICFDKDGALVLDASKTTRMGDESLFTFFPRSKSSAVASHNYRLRYRGKFNAGSDDEAEHSDFVDGKRYSFMKTYSDVQYGGEYGNSIVVLSNGFDYNTFVNPSGGGSHDLLYYPYDESCKGYETEKIYKKIYIGGSKFIEQMTDHFDKVKASMDEWGIPSSHAVDCNDPFGPDAVSSFTVSSDDIEIFDHLYKKDSFTLEDVDEEIRSVLGGSRGEYEDNGFTCPSSDGYPLEGNKGGAACWKFDDAYGMNKVVSDSSDSKFKLTVSPTVINNAIKEFNGGSSEIEVMSNEGYSLYQSYVLSAIGDFLLDEKPSGSDKYVNLVKDGKIQKFYYDEDWIKSKKSDTFSTMYNVVGKNVSGYSGYAVYKIKLSGDNTISASLDDIIALLNGTCDVKKKGKSGTSKCSDYVDPSLVNVDFELSPSIVPPSEPEPGEDDESVKPTCANSAGALGWIICPIMTTIADAAESAYDFFIMPSLKVSPELLSGDDNGAHGAWKTFRDFSNIALIAFLLFIIFSQVTGFGIDNYGIKKSLPKLIVAAIMTNASYLICQLTVDLSNILGAGLYEIFGTLSDNVSVSSVNVANASTFTVSGTLASIGLLVAMVAGIGSLIAAISANGIAIIIPIFLAVISVGISIATLFVILAVRKAGVLVLVVISPLAFILYSLPNTKRLFSKWFNSLKALLLVYPITGALVGGGNFVSRLLLSGSGNVDFWMALTAMIVGIVPIFFIPTLLKQSLSMLGNIGAKVSGVGRTVGSRTKRSADNSKLANHIRGVGKFQGQKNEYRKAQRTLGKYGDRDPRSLSASKLSKIAAAQGTVDAHDKSMKGLYSTQYKNMGTDQLKDSIDKMRIDALSGGVDTLPMVAALSELSGRDPDAFWEQYTKVSDSKGFQDTMKNDASSRERVAELLSSQTGNPFAKTAAKQLRKLDGADPSKTAELTSVRTMMQGSGFREKFQGLGVAAMRDMDKDVLGSASKDSNMARMFSSEQIQAGMTADYDDSTRSSFNDMMKTRALSVDSSTGASMLSSDLSSMTAEQLLRADSSTLDMIANDQYETTDVNGNTVMQSVSAYDGFSSRTMAEAMAKGGSGKNAGALGEILAKRSNINDLDALSASQLASVSPEHITKIREGMIEKAKAQGRSDADAASYVDAEIKNSLGSKWNEIKANNNLKGRVHPNLEAALRVKYW